MINRLSTFFAFLFAVVLLVFVSAAIWAGIVQAVSLPNGTAIFETSLSSRISSTDTTMTLASNSANGETVNGYDCFTLDEGTSVAEYVCGTVSGTSVTGLARGISYANGTTTSTTRAHAHRVGASVKKTDFPLIQRMRNILNGTEGAPNPLTYASHPDFSAAPGTAIPDVTYVAGLVGGGVGVPLSASVGGTGAPTLPPMLLQGNGTSPVTGTSTPTVAAITATSTATSSFAGPLNNTYAGVSTSTFAGNLQVQGNASTTGNIVFNGAVTSNATTTIAASNVNSKALCINGVCYAYPSSQGANGTTYVNDGSGGLTWSKPGTNQYSLASTTASALGQNKTVTSNSLTIPAGILTASSTISIFGDFACATGGSGGTCHLKLIDTGGTTYLDQTISPGTSGNCSTPYTLRVMANNSISVQASQLIGSCMPASVLIDESAIATASANWANATNFQMQFTTSNTTGITATVNGFVMTVNP